MLFLAWMRFVACEEQLTEITNLENHKYGTLQDSLAC